MQSQSPGRRTTTPCAAIQAIISPARRRLSWEERKAVVAQKPPSFDHAARSLELLGPWPPGTGDSGPSGSGRRLGSSPSRPWRSHSTSPISSSGNGSHYEQGDGRNPWVRAMAHPDGGSCRGLSSAEDLRATGLQFTGKRHLRIRHRTAVRLAWTAHPALPSFGLKQMQ